MNRSPQLCLFVLSLAYARVAMAQAAPLQAGYAIKPRYTPGQSISLFLESRIEDARDNPPEQVYRAPITLRVLSNGTSGTQLEWKAGKGSLQNDSEATSPMLKMAEQIIAELGLIVQLDADGRYIGIQNEAALRSRVEVFANLLIPQATAKISDAAQRRRAAAAMTAALSPEAMLSAARKELDLYFGISGLRLDAGKVVRKKSSLLGPFSLVGAMNGEMEIAPVAPDSKNGEVSVEFNQRYNPTQTFQTNSGSGTALSGGELSKLTLDDWGSFTLDRTTWQVREVRHIRTIRRNKEAVRTETTIITLK